jgi:ribosome biogenesis protein Nip4
MMVPTMSIEMVDPVEWSEITKLIDEEFGQGATRKLLTNRVPVALQKNDKRQFFLVPANWTRLLEDIGRFEVSSLGLMMGEIDKGRFRFSLQALDTIAKITDSKIIVSRKGAEAFTYGRSILKESVLSIDPGLERGSRVLVMNEEGDCLGIGSLTIDSGRLERLSKDKLVVKNLIDIGAYVRGA